MLLHRPLEIFDFLLKRIKCLFLVSNTICKYCRWLGKIEQYVCWILALFDVRYRLEVAVYSCHHWRTFLMKRLPDIYNFWKTCEHRNAHQKVFNFVTVYLENYPRYRSNFSNEELLLLVLTSNFGCSELGLDIHSLNSHLLSMHFDSNWEFLCISWTLSDFYQHNCGTKISCKVTR